MHRGASASTAAAARALYGSVGQWLTAYETAKQRKRRTAGSPRRNAIAPRTAAAKPRKLSYREQQEWEQMEAAILAAEQAVAECEAAVEQAATAGHVALTEACRPWRKRSGRRTAVRPLAGTGSHA